MKKKILVLSFFLLSNIIFCQETEGETKYKKETKSLIRYLLSEFLSKPNWIERTATLVNIEDCRNKYESPIFNKEELEYIKLSIDNPKITYWTQDFFPTSQVVESRKIQKRKDQGIETIAYFSSPIFLRNYEIALIRFSVVSGELSGVGYEGIFIKKGDIWEIDVCSWDN